MIKVYLGVLSMLSPNLAINRSNSTSRGCVHHYTKGRKFLLKLKFTYFANGKSAYLNSAYYYIFENLSMIAYIIESRRSKFVILYLIL